MSVLGNIQQQIADQLSADAFFANITVLPESIGDIINQCERALGAATAVGGKAGGFVLVLTPTANSSWPNVDGPFFDNIDIAVQITVNIPVAGDPNIGIGVSALDIAERVCSTLHQFYPLAANAPLTAKSPTISLADRGGENGSDVVTYVCAFKTMGGLRTLPPQAATPQIFNFAGEIELSCDTPGAALFYTMDGSNPAPLNPNATFYNGAFSPATGLTLKVRAFLAGYLISPTATITT